MPALMLSVIARVLDAVTIGTEQRFAFVTVHSCRCLAILGAHFPRGAASACKLLLDLPLQFGETLLVLSLQLSKLACMLLFANAHLCLHFLDFRCVSLIYGADLLDLLDCTLADMHANGLGALAIVVFMIALRAALSADKKTRKQTRRLASSSVPKRYPYTLTMHARSLPPKYRVRSGLPTSACCTTRMPLLHSSSYARQTDAGLSCKTNDAPQNKTRANLARFELQMIHVRQLGEERFELMHE